MNLSKISWWLLVLGGLNWALVGLFGKDLLMFAGLSLSSWLARLVYLLVGISALYAVFGKRHMSA